VREGERRGEKGREGEQNEARAAKPGDETKISMLLLKRVVWVVVSEAIFTGFISEA